MDAGYELLEHTADAGVTAWGPDPAAAFAQAARGMFAIILGTDPAAWTGSGRPGTLEVAVEGQDWPDLLVNWLSEILFHFEVDAFVPLRVTVQECTPPRCSARCDGLHLDTAEEIGGVGIKAITYHQIAVDVGAERTDVRVIFDI